MHLHQHIEEQGIITGASETAHWLAVSAALAEALSSVYTSVPGNPEPLYLQVQGDLMPQTSVGTSTHMYTHIHTHRYRHRHTRAHTNRHTQTQAHIFEN